MTKPLHVGRAAETAVVARDLAAAGLTANQSILDGPFGLLDMWSGDLPRAEQRVAQLGQRYGLEDPGVAIKRYPSCSNTHPAVDALLELRAEGLVAEDVARIICRVAPGTETILQYERPQSPLQAKFSMHYCLAAALVRGKLWIDDFEPDAVNDSDVGRIIDRVELVLDPDLAIGSEGVSTAAEVSVETNDGGRFVRRAGTPHGSRSSPLTLNELRNKFGMCAEPVLEDRVDAVFDRLLAIDDENDVASLLNELAPRGG